MKKTTTKTAGTGFNFGGYPKNKGIPGKGGKTNNAAIISKDKDKKEK